MVGRFLLHRNFSRTVSPDCRVREGGRGGNKRGRVEKEEAGGYGLRWMRFRMRESGRRAQAKVQETGGKTEQGLGRKRWRRRGDGVLIKTKN